MGYKKAVALAVQSVASSSTKHAVGVAVKHDTVVAAKHEVTCPAPAAWPVLELKLCHRVPSAATAASVLPKAMVQGMMSG